MSAGNIQFVRSDEGDWIGLYVDSKLITQGHSIQEEDVARALVEAIPIDNILVANTRWDWDADANGGQLPPRFWEIRWLKSE